MSPIETGQQTDMRDWLNTVEALRHAPDWAADDLPVEIIQTHISVVLLSKRHALKLKKPVNFGFLDYTTLEKRHRACEAEVSLNRRLCPDIYLNVQPIIDVSGQPRLCGTGKIIDYGVLMKRLPADRMLDQMVARDEVTEPVIDRVAERLSIFHREARRGPDVDHYGSREVIRGNWEENFTQTAPYIGRTIAASDFEAIRAWIDQWMKDSRELLQRRMREGRICDGHGDVRSESICITDGICIFDCIEFNERFRCADLASEVAFLAMDLDVRGRPDLGYYFSQQYETRVKDAHLFSLLPFYRCYRAFVRGKVLSFRLDEEEFSKAEQDAAALRARAYFSLAKRYATQLQKPTVIAVAGLPGSGKTSLARSMAGELGLRVVSADAARKSIFGGAQPAVGYGEWPYTADANRLAYEKMIEKGRELLKTNIGVILDATFRRATDRARGSDMARAAGADWRLIECRLSPELTHMRLDRRAARREGLSEATWDTYLRQRAEFEPIDHLSDARTFVLDMSGNLSLTSHTATDWLREKDGWS
jgi:aminoglycoside phosphotransferase family enzyme/predicted kinase